MFLAIIIFLTVIKLGLKSFFEDLLTQADYGQYAQDLMKELDNNEIDDFRNRLTNNLELVNVLYMQKPHF